MAHRRLDRYSRIKPSILVASVKNQRAMFCESTTEKDYLIELELDPRVVAYQTQPESYTYEIITVRNGRRHMVRRRYTPDVLIKYVTDEYEYVEVRTERGAASSKFQAKINYLIDLFPRNLRVPLRLCVRSGSHRDPRSLNLRKLYRYRPCTPSPDCLRHLADRGQVMSFGDALDHAASTGYAAPEVLTLMAHGQLTFDFDIPLDEDTKLRVAHA